MMCVARVGRGVPGPASPSSIGNLTAAISAAAKRVRRDIPSFIVVEPSTLAWKTCANKPDRGRFEVQAEHHSSTYLTCYRCNRRRWRYITNWSRLGMTTYCFADQGTIGQWYVSAVVRELTAHRPWGDRSGIQVASRRTPTFARTAATEARGRDRSRPRALLVPWANAWRFTQRNPLIAHKSWRSDTPALDTRCEAPTIWPI